MIIIKADDLYAALCAIKRLPDKYVKHNGMYDGVYNSLSAAEIERLKSWSIKIDN